jgi:hypothetical protein
MINLMTVEAFAALIGISRTSVFAMLKNGLPSIKAPGVGRRIIRDQAEAWILAGGPRRARTVRTTRAA